MKKASKLLLLSLVLLTFACDGLTDVDALTGSCNMTLNGNTWKADECGSIINTLNNGTISDEKGVFTLTIIKGKENLVAIVSTGFKGAGTYANFVNKDLLAGSFNVVIYTPNEDDHSTNQYFKSGKLVITKYTDPKSLLSPGSVEGTFDFEVVGLNSKTSSIKNGSFRASVIGL
jgi:hypothetical protein